MIAEIGFWFLLIGLIFPRLTLFITYFWGNIPLNYIPFVCDVFGAIFVPRFLIAIYCFTLGYPVWGTFYLIFQVLEWLAVGDNAGD